MARTLGGAPRPGTTLVQDQDMYEGRVTTVLSPLPLYQFILTAATAAALTAVLYVSTLSRAGLPCLYRPKDDPENEYCTP